MNRRAFARDTRSFYAQIIDSPLSSVELLRLKLHRAIIGLVSTRKPFFPSPLSRRIRIVQRRLLMRNDYRWKELPSTRATNFQQIFPAELNSWTSTPRLGNLVNFVEVSSIRTRQQGRRRTPPRVEEGKDGRKKRYREKTDLTKRILITSSNSEHVPTHVLTRFMYIYKIITFVNIYRINPIPLEIYA